MKFFHDDYSWITKKRQKGLNLFKRVMDKMDEVEAHILRAREECLSEIEEHKKKINEHVSALQFLDGEHAATSATKEKLLGFLG